MDDAPRLKTWRATVKLPAVPTRRGRDGATCSAGVALATQVESLRNPAKPRKPFIPVATYFAQGATTFLRPPKRATRRREVKSHRAFWRRRVKPTGTTHRQKHRTSNFELSTLNVTGFAPECRIRRLRDSIACPKCCISLQAGNMQAFRPRPLHIMRKPASGLTRWRPAAVNPARQDLAVAFNGQADFSAFQGAAFLPQDPPHHVGQHER